MNGISRKLQRLAIEVDGWLDLGCSDRALERVQPLIDDPAARSLGLALQARAFVAAERFADALLVLERLRGLEHDAEWLDLTEGWCRKRVGDLPGAIAAMERLVQRNRRSAIGHFNLACYHALHGEGDRAVHALTIACGLDPALRAQAAHEGDLSTLRGDPRFDALLPREPD